MIQNPSGVRPGLDNNSAPGLDNNSAQGNQSGGGFNPLSFALPAGIALANYFGGESTNDANSAEAANNRAFAADQSKQAMEYDENKTRWQATHGYQNAATDMRKAGLNPQMMYAGKGGAESGTGGGGSAAGAPGNPQHTNALGQGLSSGYQAASMMNDLRNTDADILMKQAQTLNYVAQEDASTSSARHARQETSRSFSETQRSHQQYAVEGHEAKARVNRATLDLKHDARERILNQVRTGVNSAADLVGAYAKAKQPGLTQQQIDLQGLKGVRTR